MLIDDLVFLENRLSQLLKLLLQVRRVLLVVFQLRLVRPYFFLSWQQQKVSVCSMIQTHVLTDSDHMWCVTNMTYFEIADLVLLVLLIFFRWNKFLIDFFELGLFRFSKFLDEVGPLKEFLKLLLNRHYGGSAATQRSTHFLSCFNQLGITLDAFDLIETGLESLVHFISTRLNCAVDKVEVKILSYSKQTNTVRWLG